MKGFSSRVADLFDRVRESLFYVPAFYLAIAGLLSVVTSFADSRYGEAFDDLPFLIPTTVNSARAIMTTVAGATITVAGIVFSITVVAVQLASSQFSPRVLRGFLRDRFQQNVIGFVVGTFTYALIILSLTRVRVGEDAGVFRSFSVTLTVVLGVLAMLAIVAFIDHSANNMRVGRIVRRVADETEARIVALFPEEREETESTEVDEPLPQGPSMTLRSRKDGWVQRVDVDDILEALPAGSVARLDARPGGFIGVESALVTVWPAPEHTEDLSRRIHEAFKVGRTRHLEQDPSFGLQQLVDIALRALSPGINDPTTAVEVVVHIGGIVRLILVRELPGRVSVSSNDAKLFRPVEMDRRDYVHLAFRDIRIFAAGHPTVLLALIEVIGGLLVFLDERGLDHRSGPLRREAELALHHLRSNADLLEEDKTVVFRAAARYGLEVG